MMKTISLLIALFLIIPVADQAWGQEKNSEKLILIMDTAVLGRVGVGKSSQSIEGRFSVEAEATAEEMEKGIINIVRANLILYQFDQSSLNGDQKNPVGPISFFLNPSGRGNRFKYDSGRGTLSASLPGQTHYKTIDAILGFDQDQKDELPHDFVSATQESNLEVEIALGDKLPGSNDDQTKLEGKVTATVVAQALDRAKLPEISIEVYFPTPPIIIVIWYPYWEVVRTLPIQPIAIRSSAGDANPSGDSYNPLILNVRDLWRKAGILFEERAFQTVTSASLKTFSSGEEASMLALHDSVDAVEIFYAAAFSPVSLNGGGACYSGGTEEAKIITSDGNDNGVDLTHLAHELGHALTLAHPGTGYPTASRPYRRDGNTGTLMCPSGYLRDNPARQSDENAANANNPLLRLAVTFRSAATTDCVGDASCGSCAAHMD
jgi:hypothetical protein